MAPFPLPLLSFFACWVLATRLKFRICCESLWPFIQAGFWGFVGHEIRTQDFNGNELISRERTNLPLPVGTFEDNDFPNFPFGGI